MCCRKPYTSYLHMAKSTRIFNATPALTSLRFLASGQLFLTITKSEQESLCKHSDVHHHKQYVLCANNTGDRAKFMFIIFVIIERFVLAVLSAKIVLFYTKLCLRCSKVDIGGGLYPHARSAL